MEQLRQIGEVIGSLNTMMIFKEDITINQRQCCLLGDIFACAYTTIAQEIKNNLIFEEKSSKWKVLESPLREIFRVFKEGETYIKQCLEDKDWWAKTIIIYQNKDCVELHIHNLLSHVPMVIEAIELAGEISGRDHGEIQKKRYIYSLKYQKDYRDPNIFQWKFGDQYVITKELCNRIDSAYDEDRWILLKKLQEMKIKPSSSKKDHKFADALLRSLNSCDKFDDKLLPCSILVSSKDYQVRRRLGGGSQYKEIHWLGESFVLRQILGDLEEIVPNHVGYFDLSHPNIMNILCGFADDEKKECLLVMELMSKDLSTYIKEICGTKKKIPFSLPVTIDLMLQIARGMEYLHHKKIYHGDLNPFNILVKSRHASIDGYMQAKVSGFGLSSRISFTTKTQTPKENVQSPTIWYAPEVLAEQEDSGNATSFHPTEKADVYSFGMVCFEVLTGKVPFEDSHLQGDKMSRNIKAGERPLFPSNAPKYVTNLTKKCWHADPSQRPSFSSICRILRYMKRFLVMNPENNQLDPPMPQIDYNDIETGFLRCFPSLCSSVNLQPVTQIPFHMFAYKIGEKDKSQHIRRETSESGSDVASTCGDDNVSNVDDPLPSPLLPSPSLPLPRKISKPPELTIKRHSSASKRFGGVKSPRNIGLEKGANPRHPPMNYRRNVRMNSESQLILMSTKTMRKSGHVSDSEL